MKYIILLLLSGTLLNTLSIAETFSPNHEKVKAIFQSNDEPTAKDALWTADDIFKVGVIDDGSSRDGYAKYVCETLYEYGFKGKKVWVQIIDIVKLSQNGEWITLGQSKCS